MPIDPKKIQWLTAQNVREVLMFLFVWLPLRIIAVKALWGVFGTDVSMTWGVAVFIAFVCPFVRPNLTLHYNSWNVPLEMFTQRAPSGGTAGKPN